MSKQLNDYGGPVGARSGAVTAVGIITIIFGALGLIFSLAFAFLGSVVLNWFMGAASGAAQQHPGMTPEELKQLQQGASTISTYGTVFFMGVGGCVGLICLVELMGGVGVVKRRQWGRIITLIFATLAGLGAIGSLLSKDWISFAIGAAYAVFAYVVLLNSANAAEFRSAP